MTAVHWGFQKDRHSVEKKVWCSAQLKGWCSVDMRAHPTAQQKAAPKVGKKEQLLVDNSGCSKGRPTDSNSE
jgi:hypothetical protein